ncbi:unnamed protein product [Leuciscus chuanchicus]
MTATVKVIRESEELQSPDKVVPKCFCGLLGRVRDCGIPVTRKQTLGKCPFSFPPSRSPSPSPPSISLCPGQRDYGIRMEEHLIVSQKPTQPEVFAHLTLGGKD